ncbi:phage tail protein, partial [Klebsiella pneumoniae]|uniref:phage tail protein n=2 Tax=Klebsiella TaxID=570 RepID=UPI0015F2C4CF
MAYYAILTEHGEERFAQAALTGEQVGFAEMAVGDGAGAEIVPTREFTGLVNELYRAPLNRVAIADQAKNVIRTEMIMLPEVGGFWLREAALYDDDGVCLAIASIPPSYKPLLNQGAGRLQALNIWISVARTADVVLKTDPAVIIATASEVLRAKSEAKDYTDKVAGQLDNDIQRTITYAITAAKRDFWEDDNPVGTTRFFNQNINPNERWPWSQWV